MRSPDRAWARARVHPQRSAYEERPRGTHLLDLERPLPVAELSDVEVALGGVDPGDPHPAEEDVAHRLQEVLLEHGGSGFLRLQHERVVVVPAEEKDHPGPCADATDADDLP